MLYHSRLYVGTNLGVGDTAPGTTQGLLVFIFRYLMVYRSTTVLPAHPPEGAHLLNCFLFLIGTKVKFYNVLLNENVI